MGFIARHNFERRKLHFHSRARRSAIGIAAFALFLSQPINAQDAEASGVPIARQEPLLQNVFSGDWVTAGIGAGYAPSYEGSDDYNIIPAPVIRGSVSGFDFGARGPGLYVDVIRDSNARKKTEFILGPQVRVRLDRNNRIKDAVVKRIGKLDTAVELGFTSGVSIAKIINPYDRLSFGIDAGWDAAGAHKGAIISPSVTYSTPLSRAIFTSLSVSADHASGKYARYYYSIDAAGSALSGLPVYTAGKGWKSAGATVLGGYDLSGNARDGGFAVFGLVNHTRLTGDAKRTPLTSLRGSAGQWFVAGGISYTF